MIALFGALVLYSLFPEYRTAAILLWPLAYAWAWIEWICTQLKIPFTIDLFRYLPHIRNFTSSIRALQLPVIQPLCLFAFSYLFVKPLLPLWLPLFLTALLAKLKIRKKEHSAEYKWTFPTENSIPLSSPYPLLRKTVSFKGEKQFEYIAKEKPHVLFIFLESFRAKNVGCLGGQPAVTPHFDRLSEQGALFTRFYANSIQTFRAMISSLFGVPPHLDTVDLHTFCRIPMMGLPEILKKNSYQTALMQGGHTGFDWTFPFLRKHHFDTIVGMEDLPSTKKTSWGIDDETLFQHATDWLQKQEQPTFLSLFTITNHHPWESPKPFPTPSNLAPHHRRYLETFAYTDECLGHFIEQLKQTGLLEKSLVFIMGDHGQEMADNEKEIVLHHNLNDENIHIPLLIVGPEKKRIDQPASQVDLLPTVLDLLNLSAIHHSVGRSLARKEERPVFASIPRHPVQLRCIGDGNVHSYFQSIEKIYAHSAWTSWGNYTFESHTLDHSNPPSPILNLSKVQMTDQTVQSIGKKGKYLYELDLSNSPLITDHSLDWVAGHCPGLTHFSAAQCLLLTNRGASAIVNRCTKLRYLDLSGLDDLTDLHIEKPIGLDGLQLKNCHNLSGDALVKITQQCPHLHYLSANLEKTTDEHLNQININELVYLSLEDGSITEAGLNTLIRKNPRLTVLTLENLPRVKRIDFSPLKWIHVLKITDCDQLTDETIESLANVEIQNLILLSCPHISPDKLQKLSPRCQIVDTRLRSFWQN